MHYLIKKNTYTTCAYAAVNSLWNEKNPYTFLQYSVKILILCFKNKWLQFWLNDNREGLISKCWFDTADNVCSPQGVEELKVKLANYNNFSGLAMEDASKGLMLLKGIVDKGSAPCSAKYISDRDYLSSIILDKYIVCDICRLRSTHFKLLHLTCALLYTIRDILMTVEISCLYRLLWKDLSL